VTEDAKRMARRFHDVFQTIAKHPMAWDEVPLEHKVQLIKTFDELIKAEAVFPGSSLYAGP
jgi:hypothetical protein